MPARSTLAALAAAVAVLVLAPGAHAAIPYAPCDPVGFQCGQLAVPLDRTGAVPGTVTLKVKRVVASSNPTATAVVALAGGPGQAALPVATEFASILGPSLATRDLLVFDQRGTGSSGRLSCPAFDRGVTSIVDAAAQCANQLGPTRGFYRTSDSVDDIEALRVESGYQKLVLFGVSYGTKVALDYAAKYPANVESLVLDSVVPPEGSDVLNVSTFKTMPRALGELCGAGACNGITTSVGHDLFNLVHKVGRKPISGKVNTPGGNSLKVSLDQDGVLDILLAGDLNPTLRSELPGAMRSAIKNDTRPLLRLLLRAKGLTGIPDARAQGPLDESDSDALFAATRCEESAFPWDRNAGPEQRASQALAAARAHPATDFQPFNYKIALRSESIPVCLAWPNASPPPAPPAALPPVPTLILSGGFDLRTPRRGRRQRRRAHPRGPARRGALHRPLGGDQRPQRLREERDGRLLRGPARRAVPECPAGHRAVADLADAPVQAARAHDRDQDDRRGDGDGARRQAAVPGRRDRRGARDAGRLQGRRGCAPATRRPRRMATTCAGSSSSPA